MQSKTNLQKTGNAGEEKAAKFLEDKNYQVLQKNYHSAYGEIDLIAKKDNELVFVEVKTRKVNSLTSGEEAVDESKIQKIIKTIFEYLEKNNLSENTIWRIDVISIEKNNQNLKVISHLENVAVE